MITNPVKAIGAWCLDCCGGSQVARKECGAPDCVLYPFRFGKNPYRSRRDSVKNRRMHAEKFYVVREKTKRAEEKCRHRRYS